MPGHFRHVAVDTRGPSTGRVGLSVFLVGTDYRTVVMALHAKGISGRRGRRGIQLMRIMTIEARDAVFVHDRVNEFIALHSVLLANAVCVEFLRFLPQPERCL